LPLGVGEHSTSRIDHLAVAPANLSVISVDDQYRDL
jgi:hypothetical protein